MAKSIEGIYRHGKVELLGPPPPVDESRVIVTFLSTDGPVDLASRGIAPDHAAQLRLRLQSFAEDWEAPEMSVYDEL